MGFLKQKFDCLLHGHQWVVVDGDKTKLVYQKGEARPTRFIFKGKYFYCKKCPATRFEGDPHPIAKELVSE